MTKNSFFYSHLMWILIACISLPAFIPSACFAQYTLDDNVSFIYIKGTSTLHDWTAIVMEMKGTLQAEVNSDHITEIKSARITIPAQSLKSEKVVMDKNIYKALKSNIYPEIIYEHESHIIHDGTITVAGEITIAGVTKTITTRVTQEEVGKHIKIDGDVNLKMSDFKVKPPEFLGGAFKTGDKITITFHFMFLNNN